MQNGLRSSSSRKAALLVLTSVLAMAGCTNGIGLLADIEKPGALRLATLDSTPEITASTSKAVEAQNKPDVVEIRPATLVGTDQPENSAWCRYLKEDSAAEASILRSPTLSGNVDDGGKAAVSLGVSVSSFTKASLVEKAAKIKCRRYLAETGLQKLVFISPQGLTAAGFRAKSESIQARRTELASLRRLINAELMRGNIEVEKATSLSVLIDQIIAAGNAAKSQADRRLADDYAKPQGAAILGADLIKAEADMEDIDSRIRSADAMDVSLSAGWNDADVGDGFNTRDNSFSGKVSFSLKLGAISPLRFVHERRAKEAKLSAIREEEGGALWQIQMLYRAHQRALAGLSESQSQLEKALAEATKLVTILKSAESPEFIATLIGAKIQVVRLQADKAAIDGTIIEIDQNMKRLKIG